MYDRYLALLLLGAAIAMLAYGLKHQAREQRARDWESHVTSAPGLGGQRATDWDAWADELRGRA